jgi:hypothetical protein
MPEQREEPTSDVRSMFVLVQEGIPVESDHLLCNASNTKHIPDCFGD